MFGLCPLSPCLKINKNGAAGTGRVPVFRQKSERTGEPIMGPTLGPNEFSFPSLFCLRMMTDLVPETLGSDFYFKTGAM